MLCVLWFVGLNSPLNELNNSYATTITTTNAVNICVCSTEHMFLHINICFINTHSFSFFLRLSFKFTIIIINGSLFIIGNNYGITDDVSIMYELSGIISINSSHLSQHRIERGEHPSVIGSVDSVCKRRDILTRYRLRMVEPLREFTTSVVIYSYSSVLVDL